MKKCFMFFIVLIHLAMAQNGSRFNVGVSLDANFSTISTEVCQRYKPYTIPNFKIGALVQFKHNEWIRSVVELAYNRLGSNWGKSFWGMAGHDYGRYDLRYISLFTYQKYRSNIGNFLKNFDFIFGLVWSYNIYARQKWYVEWGGDEPFDPGPETLNDLNKFELGYYYGVSFPYFKRVNLKFTAYHAITTLYNSYKHYKDDLILKSEFKNLALSVGIEFFIFH